MAEQGKIEQVRLKDKMEMEKLKVERRREEAQIEKDKMEWEKNQRMELIRIENEREIKKWQIQEKHDELERQEKVREREFQIKMQEMEVQKKNESNAACLDKSFNMSVNSSEKKPIIINSNSGRIDVPKMGELDFELDTYLIVFERTAKGQGWAKEKWVSYLSAQFNRKSQDLYSRIPNDLCQDYEEVKSILLEGFNLGPEAYRKKFKSLERNDRENFREFGIRVKETMQKWLIGEKCHDYDDLVQFLLVEKFYESLPRDLVTMLKDRKIKQLEEIAKLADDLDKTRDKVFSQNKFQSKMNNFSSNRNARIDHVRFSDNNNNHFANNKYGFRNNFHRSNSAHHNDNRYRAPYNQQSNFSGRFNNQRNNFNRNQSQDRFNNRRDKVAENYPNKFHSRFHHVNNFVSKGNAGSSGNSIERSFDLLCKFCKKNGHIINNCELFKIECNVCGKRGHKGQFCYTKSKYGNNYFIRSQLNAHVFSSEVMRDAYVNNQKVKCLKDSGSSITLVNGNKFKKLEMSGEFTVCSTAFNTKHTVPMAYVNYKGREGIGKIKVGVVDGLPFDMILGDDIKILENNKSEFCAAITRSKAKILEATSEITMSELPHVMLAKPKPMRLDTIEEELPSEIPNEENEKKSLFEFESLQGVGKAEFAQEQQSCNTLINIRRNLGKVVTGDNSKKEVTHYFMHKGLIYRKYYFVSIHKLGETSSMRQLVVPAKFRRAILSIAHDEPLASHIGIIKVRANVLKRFYWPNVFRDIQSYVTSCEQCQKVGKIVKRAKAPMIITPVKSKPFSKIIIDIVGPLEKSLKGNMYLLVCIDVHTHYPEVFPMKTVDSKHIADELIQLFSRVGLVDEIQSDQGTAFISNMMQQFYRVLGVKHIRSSAFHPETNALCERLNGTIKKLIKTCLVDKDKRLWDTILPLVMFAIRSSKHSTTGFTPFELLYGYDIKGPLDIVKELWSCDDENKSELDLHSYIVKLRETMRVLSKTAVERELNVKHKIKERYDKNAKEERYEVGEKVFVMLPHKVNSLSPMWAGPYEILKILGPVDYLVLLHDRVKKTRVVHYNMLRKYQPRINCFIVNKETFDVDVPASFPSSVKRTMSSKDIKIPDELNVEEKRAIESLLKRYDEVFSDLPGVTDVLRHEIRTIDDEPINVAPYPVPQALRETVQKEINVALALGLIKPVINEVNPSNYASPTILVKKHTEGEYRIVVDYRQLNLKTLQQHQIVPNALQLLDQVASANYISVFDLTKGYNQLKIVERDVHKTGFICLGVHYVSEYMMFGLSGSASSFQLMINIVLAGMENFARAYIDDICVYSNTWLEHLNHIEKVLMAIKKAKLTIKPSKVQVARRRVKFLGHMIGGGKKAVDDDKIKVLNQIKVPRTKKDVRAFLGFIGFYRNFIANYSEISVPLTNMLKKDSPDLIPWNAEAKSAFEHLRGLLQKAPILISPNFDEKFYVLVDSSLKATGGVLCQMQNKTLMPIMFLGKKFSESETRLSALEREALGVIIVLTKLRYFLIGRPFVLVVDAKPLIHLKNASSTNPKLLRWSIKLMEYDYSCEHIAGKDHVVADFLSRYINFTNDVESDDNVAERL